MRTLSKSDGQFPHIEMKGDRVFASRELRQALYGYRLWVIS